MAIIGTGQVTLVDLTDAYSVILTSEAYVFPGTTSAAKAGSTTTQIIAMRGASQVAASVTLSECTVPTGITLTKDTDATAPTLTITASTSLTAHGEVVIPVHIGTDITITKKFSVGIAFTGSTGNPGATGAPGKGISSTSVTYQASSSGTTAPTGTWSSTIPAVSASQYLWSRTILTYTDSTTSTSYAVGMMGAKGDAGATGAPGADAITLSITSSNGLIFKNTAVSTVLTAHVYKAGVELTAAQIAAIGTISWYKDGSTTAAATGTTLTIDSGDVTNQASYVASIAS